MSTQYECKKSKTVLKVEVVVKAIRLGGGEVQSAMSPCMIDETASLAPLPPNVKNNSH